MTSRPLLVLSSVVVLLASPVPGDADGGAAHRAKQTLPIQLGTSGGSVTDSSKAFCCGGTLGSAVLCNGTVHILSNNHVVGRSGSAVPGEDTVQPGLIDTSCRSTGSNVVGDYLGNLVPLGTGNVDAALAVARAGALSPTGQILDIGSPCTIPAAATVGMAVAKSGRTSGLTTGQVRDLNLSVSIQYQRGCNSGKKFTITYANQISVTPGSFLVSGDSGSLMVTNDANHQPVGLLYAGSSSIGIANPIQDVIAAFAPKCGGSFTFVGASCTPTTTTGALSTGSSELAAANRAKDRHVHGLMSSPAVVGVGVGVADDTGDPVVRVYVERGRATPPVPPALDGVRVEVVHTDRFVAMVGPSTCERD
jgi:hypothetical protein